MSREGTGQQPPQISPTSNDGESPAGIEKSLAYVNAAVSEANDKAKLMENGRKSYDERNKRCRCNDSRYRIRRE
jgi:hypothetical protein